VPAGIGPHDLLDDAVRRYEELDLDAFVIGVVDLGVVRTHLLALVAVREVR